MSTSKTYTVAGVSTSNGKTKVRFANDYVSRFKILNKNGHTNVNLLELDTAMNKTDICKMLQAHDKFQDEASQSAIAEFVVRNIRVSKPAKTEVAEPVVEAPVEAEVETA